MLLTAYTSERMGGFDGVMQVREIDVRPDLQDNQRRHLIYGGPYHQVMVCSI
jgi:hypothetical protein